MELLATIATALPLASTEEGGGSFLVSPSLGLMIWTLVLFLLTMYVLKRFAFPPIAEALEKRAAAVRENLDAAERTRDEADELLAEYRERLKEAREQADDILVRSRKASEAAVAKATAEGKAKREELVAAARRDIEAETRRALEQIRNEVADLTVLATEKITRKSLDGADQKRLVEEALAEVDFSTLAGSGVVARNGARPMEEIARVYAQALFEAAQDAGRLDDVHEQLGQFADAMNESHDMRVFFFSPYFSSAEKREAIGHAVSGASSELVNFLELLAEKHRMPAIFVIRKRFDELWAKAKKRLEVTLTSAIALDSDVVEQVGAEVERQTDREIDLETDVDPEILGGLVLRVGNMVLDASLRSKLERLRKEVASAA